MRFNLAFLHGGVSFPLCKLKKVLRAAAGVSIYGTQRPPGGVVRISGPLGKRASDFFVLPDCTNPAKRLADAASEGENGDCVGESYLRNLHGSCPVLVVDSVLRGRAAVDRTSPLVRYGRKIPAR